MNTINKKPGTKSEPGKSRTKWQYFFLYFLMTILSVNVLNGSAQTVNKQLYLSDPLSLDRIDPVASADATTATTSVLTKNTAVVENTTPNLITSGSTAQGGSASPLTIAHTSGSSLNRMLIVGISSTNATPVTGVTYNGTPLTYLGGSSNGSTKAEIWYLINPPNVTANVVISWTGTLECTAGVVTLNNVDQTNPFGTTATNSGTNFPSSLSVSSNIGDMVIDVMAKTGNAPTAGASQTEIFNAGTNSVKSSSSYKTAAAGTTAMSWTTSGTNPTWATVGVAVKGNANDAIFTQTPAMGSNFTIKAGSTITIETYATVTTGTMVASPSIFAELSYGTTSILKLSNPTAWAGTGSGKITWTGTLGADLTIPSGESLKLSVSNDLTSVQFSLDYDSQTKPSKITLPTSSYIKIDSYDIYNAAYNGGSAVGASSSIGTTVYPRVVVSDPFGYSDITGLDLLITKSGGGSSTVPAVSKATSGATRTYEYAWTPGAGGDYTIQATAKEGTEGTVTAVSSKSLTVIAPSVSVVNTITSPLAGPYTLNDNIVYNIAITNTGASTITTLPLQDLFTGSCLQYVSASVAPTSTANGTLNWSNVAGAGLASAATLNITVTLKVIGNCDPASNTAKVEGAKDSGGHLVSTVSSTKDINIDEKPVANSDNIFISGTTAINVLANDTDPDVAGFLSANTSLYTVSVTTAPPSGSASINGDKTVEFNPSGMTENQTVSLVYRVTEISTGYYAEATATVHYSSVNDAPTAVADLTSTTIEKPVTINILGNDSDPDGLLQTPTITVNPNYGSVIVNADKTITYTPIAGFDGTDVLTYQICDDGYPVPAKCSTATVTISVADAYYVCKGGSNTMSVPPITDAVSYTWTIPVGATVTSTYTGTLPNPVTATSSITIDWGSLPTGSYSVCARANNECGTSSQQCSKQIIINDLQLAFATTNIACYGSNNGAINLTPSGGISPYTYAWTKSGGGYSASVEDITDLAPGTYNVTATDKYGCTVSGSATITQPASAISISETITAENPFGSYTGIINITASGGTSPYTYLWSNSSTAEDQNALTGGSYSVTVTDAHGCSVVKSFTVNSTGAPLSVSSITKTDVLCYGGSSGSINLEVIGGSGSYTYSWTGPNSFTATTQDLAGLQAGTYNVTISDGVNPTINTSKTISQPSSALSATANGTNILCNGSSTGGISLSISGGTSPYTYLWSNGLTTKDITNLSAGTYSVTIIDSNGCTTSTSATITQPTAIVINGLVADSNCNSGSSGAITLTVNGGTPNYTYLWNNGATTKDISGLAPGDYSVTVTDANGCKKSQAFSVGNACIGAAKTITSAVTNNNDGTYTLTYTIKVENTGSINLNNVQVTDNLATAFAGATGFTVNSISSSDFTVNHSFNGTSDKNLLAAPLGTLLPSGVGYVSFTVTVTPGSTLGSYLNSAVASAQNSSGNTISDISQNGTSTDPDSDGNPQNNSVSTPVTFTENPSIGVAKTVTSGPVVNGDGTYDLTYTITVRNMGDVPLKNVQVTDDLNTSFGGAPVTKLSLTSAALAVNASYTGTGANNLLDGTDIMAVNDIRTIILSIRVTPTGAGPFSNSATGTANGPGGTSTTDDSQNGMYPDSDNDGIPTDNNDPTPVTFTESPQIGLAKRLTGTPLNNQDGTYTLTYEFKVKNTGNVNLTGVNISDDLSTTFSGKPVEVISVTSSTLSINNSYNGTSALSLLSGSNTLAVGSEKSVLLTIKVTPGTNLGAYNNTATASGTSQFGTSVNDVSTNGTDVDPENDGAANNSAVTPVTFTENPQIGAAKTISSTVNNLDGTYTVTYTVLIKNTGNVPLNSIQATDDLGTIFSGAAGFTVTSISSVAFAENLSFNGTTDKNLLVGTDVLAVGASGTVVLSVKVTPGTKLGVYNNTVTASGISPAGSTKTDLSQNGSDADPDSDGNTGNNNQATPLTFTENPQIGVAKRILATPVNNGNGTYTLSYEIKVQNIGNVPLQNIQVNEYLTETFPSPASFTVDSKSIFQNPSTSTFTLNAAFNGSSSQNLLSGSNALKVGESALLRITVTVNPGSVGGPYENSAVATAQSPTGRYAIDSSQDGTDVDPDNAVDELATDNNVPTSVTFAESPKIGISKQVISVLDNKNGTNDITFKFTIENFGNVGLNDLKIFDDVVTQFATVNPVNFSASEGSLLASGSWNGTAASNILVAGQFLGVGETGTVFISFRVSPGTTTSLNNLATAEAKGPLGGTTTDTSTNGSDPDGTDNDQTPDEAATTPVNFSFANLVTVKTLNSSNSTPVEGDVVSFKITVTNNGPSKATNVTLTDILPVGLTYTGNTPSVGTYASGSGIWNGFDLTSGSSANLIITGTVNAGLDGNTITNSTTKASSDLYDPTTVGDDLTESIVIGSSVLPLKVVKDSQTNINCNGSATGTINITISDGTPPYTFAWTGPSSYSSTSEDLSGLASGTYNLTVTDSKSTAATLQVILTQPAAALAASISAQTNVACFGGSTGSATVSVSGGTSAYSYSWNTTPVQTTATATGLAAGTYTVTVTDANNCTTTASATITQPAAALAASISAQTNVACFGGSTGSATVSVSGGTSAYSYSWNTTPVQTTATATGLAAGTYTVTVTDANNCTTTASATIIQPAAALAASISAQTNVACFGGTTGSATVSVSGGTSGYTYSWAPSGGTAATATGLAAGTYTVTVTDANNCTTTASATITQPAAALAASISAQTNVACFGGSTGSATVSVSGGTSAYSYSWNTTPIQTNATATGLAAGTYTVTVTDANNCSTTASANITQPAAALAASISAQTNVACFGGTTGSATVSVSGGTSAYSYSWNTTPIQTTATATGLAAGTYTVTVTDANNCTTTASATITQPAAALAASISAQTNVACFGGSTGSATVSVTGGTSGYSYSWNTIPVQTTATATGLSAGTYTVTVTDANNCTTTASATITQPAAALTASISAQTNVACFGGTTGSATVSVSGGTSGYTYSWAPSGGTAATATGLTAGTYTVTVTDANNCTTTASATITQPATALAASISTQTNVACFGGTTGSATVSVTGGTSGYSYSWNTIPVQTTATATGLSAGTYIVTVTDANNCSTTASATITQPAAALTASISAQTNVACFGGSTGSATVSVSDGTSGYIYSWNTTPVQTTTTATGLAAGTYTVTVTDANNCTTTASATITQPATALAASISAQTNVTNFGGATGSATVSVTGGSTGYTYSWSPSGGTGATATGLSAGTYTVTVTDANNCTTTASATITQPSTALSSNISIQTNVACFGSATGSVTVSVYGGTTPYSYSWNTIPVQTTETASGLAAGTYSVIVTDANSFTTTSWVTIKQPAAALTASISAQTNVACFGGTTGLATITVTGGTAPYSYSWNTTPVQTTATATGLTAGTYTVTVTDAKNCTTTASATITQPATALAASISSQSNVACFGGANGSATVSVTGGVPPYSYNWSPSGGNSEKAVNLTSGTYTILITDKEGCSISKSVTISQPNVLNASVTSNNLTCKELNNGKITILNPTGGSGLYEYSIDGGVQWKTGNLFTNLAGGTYSVKIRDAVNKSCEKTLSSGLVISVITDIISPTIVCPSNVSIVAEQGKCSISDVKLGIPFVEDNCSVLNISNDAPASFSVGTTTVTWTVTDDSGASATCKQFVTVTSPVDAKDDSGTINGKTGGLAVVSVLNNDILNCTAVNPSMVNVSLVSSSNPNITLNGAAVSVAPETPAGTYTLRYRICEILNSSNCDEANVTIVVTSDISGKVYDDKNGLSDNLINGTGTHIDGKLHVSLVSDKNEIVKSVPVSLDGTYLIENVQAGIYRLILNTNSQGAVTAGLPSNWVNTSEGRNNLSDGTPNGDLKVSIGLSSAGCDFGIDQIPAANALSGSFPNPGGNGTLILPELNGTDAEDGIINSGETIIIQTLPANGKLYYNGIAVVSGQAIANYDPSKLTLDPNDGTITVNFTYSVVDAAGVKSSPALVSFDLKFMNNIPVAEDNIISAGKGSAVNGTVANNDIPSQDGGNVWSLKRGVFHGRLIFNSDGSFVYTPDIRYDGQDSFIYQVCDRDGDCDEATVFITVVSPKADLLVNKTVDNRSPKIGESVVFTVTVTNYGLENATGVQLTDKLPSGCIYISSAVSTGTYNNQTGLWSIGNMSSNMTATMTVKAKIYSRGDYKNVATVSGDQNDPNATNNSSEVLLDEICELFVPEIFSPNNDGIQDYFKIRCIDRYLNAKIEIYNRWGNLVYQKDHYGDTDFWGTTEAWWDGKSNQKWKLGTELLPPATYFYVLYLNNGSEKRNGYLYLNR
jgi:uncharacterized repeat protein (TIGR01451 family)/gliding motility-associated-like protein